MSTQRTKHIGSLKCWQQFKIYIHFSHINESAAFLQESGMREELKDIETFVQSV